MDLPPHARHALDVGAALVSVVALTVIFADLLLLAGGGISALTFPAAVVTTAGLISLWVVRSEPAPGWRWIAATLGGAAVVIALSLILAPLVLDATYDGQWYHQEGVLQLADGWNPVVGELTAEEVADADVRLRLNGHAKGSWIAGASLYRLTGRIEHNKSFSLLLLAAAWCLCLAALTGFDALSTRRAVLLATVMAGNPVALTQILNAQVDGDVASVALIIVSSLVISARWHSRAALVVLAATLVIGFGLKLTAPLVCTGVAAAGMVVVVVRRARPGPAVIALIIGGSLGLFVVPSSPYLLNTIRHGHPLYPAMGPDAVTLLDAPPHGRAATLFVSVFSRCRQFTTSGDAVRHLLAGGELKIPGSFDREEIKVFAMPDVRIGGFGPLFSVVCLLAAAAAIGGGRRNLAIAVAVALPLLASVVAFPYPWSARYVPQLWLVPLAVLPLALGDHRRGVRALGLCAMTAAGANILLIGVGHLYGTVPHSQMLRGRIADLAAQGTELELDLGRYRSNRARLAELGVRFREVEDPHFDLSTFLGTPKAEVLKLEASQRNGSRTFHLTLAVPPTATHHEVSVVSDDDHRVASTFRIDGPRGEIPLSHSGPIVLEIAVCNSVGCGPPLRLEPAQPAP